MQLWNIYYDGVWYGEAMLSCNYDTAQLEACLNLEKRLPKVNRLLVHATRIK